MVAEMLQKEFLWDIKIYFYSITMNFHSIKYIYDLKIYLYSVNTNLYSKRKVSLYNIFSSDENIFILYELKCLYIDSLEFAIDVVKSMQLKDFTKSTDHRPTDHQPTDHRPLTQRPTDHQPTDPLMQ